MLIEEKKCEFMFDKQNTRELNEQKAREYGKRIVDLLAAKQYKEIISVVDEIDESKDVETLSAKYSPPQMIVHRPMIMISSSLCRIFPYLVLLDSWIFLIFSFSSSIFISLLYYFFQKK